MTHSTDVSTTMNGSGGAVLHGFELALRLVASLTSLTSLASIRLPSPTDNTSVALSKIQTVIGGSR